MDDLKVIVHVTEDAKCHRCRKYLPEVGKIYKWPDVCWRCSDVMDSFEENNPDLYKKYADAMQDHPMRKAANERPNVKRLLADNGEILEVWFPRGMMTWAEFVKPPSGAGDE